MPYRLQQHTTVAAMIRHGKNNISFDNSLEDIVNCNVACLANHPPLPLGYSFRPSQNCKWEAERRFFTWNPLQKLQLNSFELQAKNKNITVNRTIPVAQYCRKLISA